MNTHIKYAVVIIIDDEERTYMAAGKDITPWDAVALAWRRVAKEMGFPERRPQEGQGQPPKTEQPEHKTQPPPARTTPDESDEPECPDHHLAKESKYGGIYCPFYDEETEEYCKWTYGKPKARAKKGGR